MANCMVKEVKKTFTLELDEEEAEFLASAMGNCINWGNGRGNIAKNIQSALHSAEVSCDHDFEFEFDEDSEMFVVS